MRPSATGMYYCCAHSKTNNTIYTFKHVLVKVALQVLVGVVDEQLLQAVCVELLEAVDVQHADEAPHVAAVTPPQEQQKPSQAKTTQDNVSQRETA